MSRRATLLLVASVMAATAAVSTDAFAKKAHHHPAPVVIATAAPAPAPVLLIDNNYGPIAFGIPRCFDSPILYPLPPCY